jgi:hypothetical protein
MARLKPGPDETQQRKQRDERKKFYEVGNEKEEGMSYGA